MDEYVYIFMKFHMHERVLLYDTRVHLSLHSPPSYYKPLSFYACYLPTMSIVILLFVNCVKGRVTYPLLLSVHKSVLLGYISAV